MFTALIVIALPLMLWLCARDLKRRPEVSSSVWMVVLWVVIIASRPVSAWFTTAPGGSEAAAYDEGNAVDRWIHLVLILGGSLTLLRRQVSLVKFWSQNRWLILFFLFWGFSVAWSDQPIISLKRWFKDAGNLVMVMLLLSEKNPITAIKSVFLRCCYILLPASVILIRFSSLGRAYHVWSGEMMYTGVATHKNSLGALVLVCGLFLVWDYLSQPERKKARDDTLLFGARLFLALLTGWLLLKARSATAIVCMLMGTVVLLALRLPSIRVRVNNLGIYLIVGSLLMVGMNSMFNLVELVVVHGLGRDMTLTTRTEVWPMLLDQSSSWLLGTGFNAFWSGERLEVIYNKLGIIQAHNGYLETFLNGGALGIIMLLGFLAASFESIKKELQNGKTYADLRLGFFLICILYNFTEASFSKIGLLWFVQLLICSNYDRLTQVEAAPASPEGAISEFTLGAVRKKPSRSKRRGWRVSSSDVVQSEVVTQK